MQQEAAPDTEAAIDTEMVEVPEAPPQAATPQAGNLLNPNVSVIGWIQASAGDDEAWEDPALVLKEAELGLQSVVDPYARADFFISFHDLEEAELEEGYLTLLTLPAGLQARFGKFRTPLGKFNVTHPGETPFADRPLAATTLLGEEGLAGTGAEVSWLAPVPVFLQLTGVVNRPPDESPTFGPGKERDDLLYLGRAAFFTDLTEAWNLNLGLSWVTAPRALPEFFDLPDSAATPRARIAAADVTLRWKNRRRAIYRSLTWQTEVYRRTVDSAPSLVEGDPDRTGGFSYVDYQFARRWHAGARGDYLHEDGGSHQAGALAFLTFTPSEFSLVSLQARRMHYAPGDDRTEGFLKLTFNIGPHGAHPF